MNKKILVLISIALMVAFFIGGAKLANKQKVERVAKQANASLEPFVRSHAQVLGNPNAKVTLIEFFDPACESCRALYPYVKQLLAQNPGKVRLVMRYAPFHKGADYYVKVLEASRFQGLYWETLEALYKTQDHWASHHVAKPKLAREVLQGTKLNLDKLELDLQSPGIAAILQQDMEDARALNVNKTPTFFVNGKPLLKFGLPELQELVASEVKLQYPSSK